MILNLTKGFYPLGESNAVEHEQLFFSGGEPHIKIRTMPFRTHINVTTRLNSMNDLGMLMVAMDAIHRHASAPYETSLVVPYFPGARQDRAQPGTALTAKVFADAVNNMGFSSVLIFDPHSDVVRALINNCKTYSNHKLVRKVVERIFEKYEQKQVFNLIVPDAGAAKKAFDLYAVLSRSGGYNMVQCLKHRDPETGELTKFEVMGNNLIPGQPGIIVDDICDGGGTFLGLADVLQKQGINDLYLVVSHGIFSRGFSQLQKYFKGIYTTDSFPITQADAGICQRIPIRDVL